MKLLADITGEKFLEIIEKSGDSVIVQFISNEGKTKGKPFKDSMYGLSLAGWKERTTSTAIGLKNFRDGNIHDPQVSFALHQLYPLGRKVKLPSGDIATIASYANTHADGYYIYLKNEGKLKRFKITPEWELLPSEKLLALPYYPAPKTQKEIDNIDEFDRWAAGF